MSQELQELQQASSAIFNEEGTIPLSFGNDSEAIAAAKIGTALSDHSGWGLLKLSDRDRAKFLHNQTTNNINSLQPGQGSHTVFVNSTGRTIDLVTAYVTEDAILVLVSPNRRQQLLDWMDRYIFPMDSLNLEDISGQYAIFSLMGNQSDTLLKKLGLEAIIAQPEASHQLLKLEQTEVRIAVGNSLALPGYTFFVPLDKSAQVWSILTTAGAIPLGHNPWEKLRIQQGRPFPNKELTEDYNPLEAGLWQAISFNKGCYIGQETIARLNTYKGVKQRLWGVELNTSVEPQTPVYIEDKKVGILTSCTPTEAGAFGLAYVRTKAGGEGSEVKVGETTGKLVAVPYLTHEYPQAKN